MGDEARGAYSSGCEELTRSSEPWMKAQSPRAERPWREGGTNSNLQREVDSLLLSQQSWLLGPGPAGGEGASWLPGALGAPLQTVLPTGRPAVAVHTAPHLLLHRGAMGEGTVPVG